MRALSVRQPWASMIASGEKTIEVRTWRTDYRGALLICASSAKGVDHTLPRGVALCIVDLVDVRPMVPADEPAAHCWVQDAYAWVMTSPRAVEHARVRGQLRLFEVDLPIV
jgi:hypothetical protein